MKLDLLRPDQIQELLDVIDNQNMIFIAQHVGWDVLLPSDQAKLTNLGFDKETIGELNYAELAFKFGMMSQVAQTQAKGMKYKDFKNFIKEGKFIPLSQVEKGALEAIQTHLYSDIKGLGNKMQKDFSSILIEEDKQQRAQYESIIRGELTQVVANRETLQNAVSRLGHATGDWSRDFGRIADYVLHDSFDRGRATAIKKFSEEDDPQVFKDVFPGSCKWCEGLYNTKDGRPRVFRLSELLANGSNIGVKGAENWLPVVGPTHPFCRCGINEVPSDSEWNEKTKSFELKKRKRKVARKSKITLRIGDDTIKV